MKQIVFVCTGNICRSPMAEGIARHRYGDIANFASGGTLPMIDHAPTGHAVDAAAELDTDIGDLRGSPLSAAFDPVPDHIYVMTRRHMAAVSAQFPELADRIELLDAPHEVADPYGYGPATYRETRDQIAQAIEARAAEWS